jgi:hypothetical protein
LLVENLGDDGRVIRARAPGLGKVPPGLGVGFVVDEGQVAEARVLAAEVLDRLQAARERGREEGKGS